MRIFLTSFLGIFILALGLLFSLFWYATRPMDTSSAIEVFVVPQDKNGFYTSTALMNQGFIRNDLVYRILAGAKDLGQSAVSGGYRLSKSMTMLEVIEKLNDHPDLVWVSVREGLRKEQVGEALATQLGWTDEQLIEWNASYADDPDYIEGVYYPDTYLLPLDETPVQIAKRFVDKFNEKIAPLLPRFAAKNIKWTTGVKIASLLEREAAGPHDMKLISGIIWKRLDIGMKLEIDATMQYTKGKTNGKWWGGIDLAEKQSDSPYNTYKYKGLPPTPISNPSSIAIEAALNPEETDCIFYLHDRNKQIHCSETYSEHKENIKKYLL